MSLAGVEAPVRPTATQATLMIGRPGGCAFTADQRPLPVIDVQRVGEDVDASKPISRVFRMP